MSSDIYLLTYNPLPGEIRDALQDNGRPWYAAIHFTAAPYSSSVPEMDAARSTLKEAIEIHGLPCELLHIGFNPRAGEFGFEYAQSLHHHLGGFWGDPESFSPAFTEGASPLEPVALLQSIAGDDINCMRKERRFGDLRGSAWVVGSRPLSPQVSAAAEAIGVEIDEVPFRPWVDRTLQDKPGVRTGNATILRLSESGARRRAANAREVPSKSELDEAEQGTDLDEDSDDSHDTDPPVSEVATLIAKHLDGFALVSADTLVKRAPAPPEAAPDEAVIASLQRLI